jgi:5-formyltetrahydrofolate cyclo-ligase
LEPLPNSPTLQPVEVDLILVPAVACDYQGYRLGYGGGYYDRLLSSPEWASKPTIGVLFDFAYLPQLPTDTWDIQLHGVCTETGLRITKN